MKRSIICIALLICMLISCSPLSDNSKEPLPSAVFNKKNSQTELHVSGEPGYAVETGGYIFYTDDEYIYRMNPDGTDKNALIKASSMKEIIPYEDWLVYQDLERQILHCYNWENGSELTLPNVSEVYCVIDDNLYFKDTIGLKVLSLNSANQYIVEAADKDEYIDNIIFNNDNLYYVFSYKVSDEYQSDLISIDYLTGTRKELLKQSPFIIQIIINDSELYYTTEEGLYCIDLNSMNRTQISDVSERIDYIYDDHYIYQTGAGQNDVVVMRDLKSGESIEICSYYCLAGLDKANGWYYYIDGDVAAGKTYRIKSDGSVRELYYDDWLNCGPYEELCIIDGWIFYFNEEQILSRINIETKQVEQVADQPTNTPWWAKI